MASVGDIIACIEIGLAAIKYFQAVRLAPKERALLLAKIDVSQRMLKNLEEVESWITLRPDSPERINHSLTSFKTELGGLQETLGKNSNRFKGFIKQVFWPSKKVEIQARLDDLQKALDAVKSCQEIEERLRHGWDQTRAWLRPHLAEEIKDTPYDIQITEGTGEGLLHSTAYRDWESTGNGVLWCHGGPGSGKTAQIKVVQNYLQNQSAGQKVPPDPQVAVVYCSRMKLRQLRDPMEVIMSLWAQLDADDQNSRPKLTDELQKELRDMKKMGGHPVFKSKDDEHRLKMNVLIHHINHSPPTILVLDGLDEVPKHHYGNLQQQILKCLLDVQKRTKHCRLLISSRQYESIGKLFDQIPTECKLFRHEVKPTAHDLREYVRERASEHGWKLREDDLAVERVIYDLVARCLGAESFLLAPLYMDEILKATNLKQLDDILIGLPSKVSDVYDRALKRLSQEYPEGSHPHVPCIGIQALYWVAFASPPLKANQLEQALAVYIDGDDDDFDQNGITKFKDLESTSAKLLTVNDSNEVSVRHLTVIEHLKRQNTINRWWQHGHAMPQYISLILMKYLSYQCVRGVIWDLSDFEEQYPLLDYALRHWGDYLREVPEHRTVWKRVVEFLTTDAQEWNDHINIRAATIVARRHFQESPGLWPDSQVSKLHTDVVGSGKLSPLHWVVHFDFINLVSRLSKSHTQNLEEDYVTISPLGLAVSHGTELMSCLLQNNANANNDRRPPLYDACLLGKMDCVRILREAGARWTQKRADNDEPALWPFYVYDHVEIAEFAVESMSDADLATADGLQLLVRGGFSVQLQHAIDAGLVNVNHQCDNGKNALDYAYELGNRETIDVLRRHGATTRLRWPAFQPASSSFPQNFPEVQTKCAPLANQRVFGEHGDIRPKVPWDQEWERVLLEMRITQDFTLPVQSLVFETVSRDQGFSNRLGHNTYLGCGHGCSLLVRIQNGQDIHTFHLQNNVHASNTFRLHTNLWNISDLEKSFPRKAGCMKSIQDNSLLQVVANGSGAGWRTDVQLVRVRVYGEEVNL